MKKKNKAYSEPDFEDVLDETKEDMFEIGKSYDITPVKLLKCRKCNSDKFYVGQGSYFTVIKCPNCNYEICIHDG